MILFSTIAYPFYAFLSTNLGGSAFHEVLIQVLEINKLNGHVEFKEMRSGYWNNKNLLKMIKSFHFANPNTLNS